jgi:hypothetical protein
MTTYGLEGGTNATSMQYQPRVVRCLTVHRGVSPAYPARSSGSIGTSILGGTTRQPYVTLGFAHGLGSPGLSAPDASARPDSDHGDWGASRTIAVTPIAVPASQSSARKRRMMLMFGCRSLTLNRVPA